MRPWRRPRPLAVFAEQELTFDGARRGQPMALAPYQRGILDAFEAPGTRHVAFLASAQAGKTVLMLVIVAHGIIEQPRELMVVQPNTRPLAFKFSKMRFDPMVQANPKLDAVVNNRRSKRGVNLVDLKTWPGGSLTIAGANTSAGLASQQAERMLFDEIDKWPLVVGTADAPEGPPMQLARRRQHTYSSSSRELSASTPTTVFGAIWKEWQKGDRCVWVVRCPRCGHDAAMTWGDVELQPGHEPGVAHYVRLHGKGGDARMTCGGCDVGWTRHERHEAALAGRWQATAEPTERGARSFYAWRAMSPFGEGLEEAWDERVKADRESRAGNPDALKEWRQGVLGVPSKNDAEDYPAIMDLRAHLERRVKVAKLATAEAEQGGSPWVPTGLVRTGAVDVQARELHVLLMGWTRSGGGWMLERASFDGDPTYIDDVCWEEAFRWFEARLPWALNIDSGYLPDVTDDIVSAWGGAGAGIAQIKGRDTGPFVAPPQLREAVTGTVDRRRTMRATRDVTRNNPLWTIGTFAGKRMLMRRLARQGRTDDPQSIQMGAWMDRADVAELVSEHEVEERDKRGRVRLAWKQVQKHNHLLDLTLYAMHAYMRQRPRAVKSA